MTKDIIFWRHAEAFDAIDGQSDLDRKLTVKGQRNAERVAHWLDRNLPQKCRVFASEAKRSQQTAHCLPRKFKVLSAINPDASAEQVLQALDWPESDDMIVVVGHQPWIGDCIAMLLNLETQQTLSVKKSAAWWLQHRSRDDEHGVVLRAVVTPELL
jgi:phosphohistidine phosphatase